MKKLAGLEDYNESPNSHRGNLSADESHVL